MMKSAAIVTLVGKVFVAVIVVINHLQCSATQSSLVSAAATAAATTTTTLTAKVVLNKSSYFPGETMKINITRTDNKTSEDYFKVIIAPANVSDAELILNDNRNIKIHYSIKWNRALDSMVFDINFLQYEEGSYRVGLLKQNKSKFILLGVADNIRINKADISINLPKKEFFQGEAVTFTINNPYINLTYKGEDAYLSYMVSHDGHKFTIVPKYPSIYRKRLPMMTDSSEVSESIIVPYDQEEYKIILERRYLTSSQVVGVMEDTVVVAEVQNSTFTVKRNYPTLDTIGRSDVDNDCSSQREHVSLTTMKNIPLKGPYKAEIVEDGKESSYARAYRTMMVKAGAIPSTRLNTTIKFRSKYFSPYRVRIMIDHKLWALSEAFYAGCYD